MKTCPNPDCVNHCVGFDNDVNYCSDCGTQLVNFEDDPEPEAA